MILRTNLPEKPTDLAGGIQQFAFMLLKFLREGIEARASTVCGTRDSASNRRSGR